MILRVVGKTGAGCAHQTIKAGLMGGRLMSIGGSWGLVSHLMASPIPPPSLLMTDPDQSRTRRGPTGGPMVRWSPAQWRTDEEAMPRAVYDAEIITERVSHADVLHTRPRSRS